MELNMENKIFLATDPDAALTIDHLLDFTK